MGGVTISGGPTTLAVGATDTTTFSGSYAITQADIDAGAFFNIATADSDESEPSDTDDETVTLPQDPEHHRWSRPAPSTTSRGDGFADAGETISYAFASPTAATSRSPT